MADAPSTAGPARVADSRRPPLLLVVVLVLVVAGAAVGARLWTVHQRTYAWALVYPEIPPRTQVGDRYYLLGSLPAGAAHLPAGAVRVGTTEGGAPLYRDPATAPTSSTPTGLWAVDSDGRVWSYALSGGP